MMMWKLNTVDTINAMGFLHFKIVKMTIPSPVPHRSESKDSYRSLMFIVV